jgi:Tol biopolymer transport system component
MGEVYRAKDSKLGRQVALKVLPPAFARDLDRMTRFEREAKVLASLNHPNIAAIYGLEENALVMELVEGQTLAERLAQGSMPLAETLSIARQISEALEYAHEKGIIHRDLKPANVKITPEDVVKVLDFGLAKFAEQPAAPADPADSPTLTIRATKAGLIMGTAAYMSPEQASGKPVDRRSDIWSFGVVLWEMLSGRKLFEGETISHTLADVLKGEIDFNRLPAGTPSAIRELLRRCLDRDVRNRLRDIGEARVLIQKHLADPAGAAVAKESAVASNRRRFLPWALAGALLLALAAVALLHFRGAPPEQRLLKYSVSPPEKARFDSIAVSPDGRRLAFIATEPGKSRLWVRPLDSLTAQPLADAELALFWSPDSRFIGFFADGKLKKVEASGDPVQTLCDAQIGNGGSWSRDGVILFSGPGLPVSRVPAEGGEAKPATSPGASLPKRRRHVFFLPDGRHYLYATPASSHPESGGIYLGALDSEDATRLLGDLSSAAYAAAASGAGYLLFWRGGSLMAQPFDPGKLRLSGAPFPVAEQVRYNASTYRASFSVSENGVLVYDSAGAAQVDQLVWFDRAGKRLGTVGEPGRYIRPSLSPDEKQVAIEREDPPAGLDLWLVELARGVSTRFTFDPNRDAGPVWSPDGRSIVFSSNREGAFDLYRKISSGAGKDELLLKSDNLKWASDWSSDGRFLLYYEMSPKTKYDMWVLPLSGGKKPIPYLQTEFNEERGAFSPDGKWIAYQSDESRRFEVYVQTFPATGAKWQVSTSGGMHPKWRRDGKELFYLDADSKMMAVEVETGAAFQAGIPRPLFETQITGSSTRYAVTRDGQRFLIPTLTGEAGSTPATVVINWMAGIKR